MISVKRVPDGWVDAGHEANVDMYRRLGAPMLNCGLRFYVPRWAQKLANEWPLLKGEGAGVYHAEPGLLESVVRRVAHDQFEDPDEGVAALLATIRLGGLAGVRALLWGEEDEP